MRAVLTCLLLAATVAGADPDVRLPDCGQAVTPAAVPVLTGSVLYVFDTDKDVLVLTSPPGLASVTKEAGPVRVKGLFIDAKQQSTRTFKGKWVYQVDPVPGAKGRVELLVVPVGAADEKAVTRKLIDVDGGTGPQPPPNPGPTPNPNPPTPPVPADVPLTGIVFIEETEAQQSARAAFLSDPAFQARMKAKGIKLRTADKDVVGPTGAPPADLVEFLDKAKTKAYPQVFFVGYRDGKRVTLGQFDLPKSMPELLTLMQQYGG